MVQAPVGFQCPDCVRDGQVVMRVRALEDFSPRITFTIIGICVAIQLLPWAGVVSSNWLVQYFSLWPRAVAAGEFWRLLTAAFLHGGLLHLLMNMYMLMVLGRQLEYALGRGRFIVLYAISALGGSAASYWFNGIDVPSVGASGAIFGLFAAIFMFGRERGLNVQEIAAVVGLNLVIGFVVPGIDWRAHMGGLVTGAIVGWALIPQRNKALQWLVPGLAVGMLLAGVLVRTSALQGLFY